MDVVYAIIQFLINFAECFIIYRIMSSVLEAKYGKKSLVIATTILFIIATIKGYLFSYTNMREFMLFGSIVMITYTLIVFFVLFKNSVFEKIIWMCIYIFGIVIIESSTMLLIRLILNQSLAEILTEHISLYIIVIGKLITILVFEIIIRSRKSKFVVNFSYFKELTIIILFNFILILAMLYVFTNESYLFDQIDHIIFVMFAIIITITINTMLLIFRLERKSKEEIATQLKLQQIELELKLNEDMIEVTDKLRKLRHDMNNHIGLIKALTKTRKFDDLEEYIDQIYEDVEIANELVITGNKTLSVLINSKKSLAKSKNIDFTSMIAAQEINMQNKDICALLGNILDNAIEAAERSGSKKYVQLMIQKTEEGCIISCENSLGVRPVVKKNKFITMKDNTLLHGIGIENIKDIVAKYQGEINFDYDDEMFNVKVIVPA